MKLSIRLQFRQRLKIVNIDKGTSASRAQQGAKRQAVNAKIGLLKPYIIFQV